MPASYAADKSKIVIEAEKLDPLYLTGEIDKRILKKYIPVRLNISNKEQETLALSDKIYYLMGDKMFKIPNSSVIFEKTKRHTVRRAILVGIPAVPVLLLVFSPIAIGASVAHSITANGTLEDNIKKNNFTPKHLFNNDSYSAYIFIPKVHKNTEKIMIKGSFNDGVPFDLYVPIAEN